MRVAMYHSNKDVRLEELPIPTIGPGELLVRLHRAHGRAVRHIRGLHRLYLDYPTEALRKAIAHALGYGLTDLVRLEKLLLKQIAGDYFRLTPPREDDDDDQGH